MGRITARLLLGVLGASVIAGCIVIPDVAFALPDILTPKADLFPYELQVPFGSTTKVDSLGEYISEIYKFFVGAAAIVAVVVMMFAGMQRLTAQGSQEAISQSTERIMHAIYGLTIALLSYIILVTINPQLIKLNYAIKPVTLEDYNALGAASFCPKSMHAICGSGSPKVIPEDQGGGYCLPIGYSGKGKACMVENLSKFPTANRYSTTSKVISSFGEEGTFGPKLEETGWKPRPGLDVADYSTKNYKIFTDDCYTEDIAEWSKEYCDDQPSRQLPCGKLDYDGALAIFPDKEQFYTLGVWCPDQLSCYIDMETVRFVVGGAKQDEGTVEGVRCQPK